MIGDIIEKIENLDSRSFSDYRYLVTGIREEIRSQYEVIRQKEKNQQYISSDKFVADIQENNLLRDKYNKKFEVYVNLFFFGEELIRNELKINSSILDEIYANPFFLQSLGRVEMFPNSIIESPLFEDAANFSTFMHNYRSGYYLQEREIKKEDNCFIATFAFNSLEHPEVILLRDFRDNTLERYQIGRNFIKKYYTYSPYLVRLFEKINFPKTVVRFFLRILIIKNLKNN